MYFRKRVLTRDLSYLGISYIVTTTRKSNQKRSKSSSADGFNSTALIAVGLVMRGTSTQYTDYWIRNRLCNKLVLLCGLFEIMDNIMQCLFTEETTLHCIVLQGTMPSGRQKQNFTEIWDYTEYFLGERWEKQCSEKSFGERRVLYRCCKWNNTSLKGWGSRAKTMEKMRRKGKWDIQH